jgi:hypothetical protein
MVRFHSGSEGKPQTFLSLITFRNEVKRKVRLGPEGVQQAGRLPLSGNWTFWEKHPLLVFDNVKGSDIPVVCNTDTPFSKFGLALGVPPEKGASGLMPCYSRGASGKFPVRWLYSS